METKESIKVFFITDGTDDITVKHDTMFLSEARAKDVLDHYKAYEDKYYYLSSKTFPFVGKYISQVEVYWGFDYSLSNTDGIIGDVIYKSLLYPSVELSKASKLWQSTKERALRRPEEHNFCEDKICSKDFMDEDFEYGDVMEGKFNMRINRYKIDRRR